MGVSVLFPLVFQTVSSKGNLTFSTDILGSIKGIKEIMIMFDVTVDENDKSDLSEVLDLVNFISPHLEENVVLYFTSQMPVGTCNTISESIKNKNPKLNKTMKDKPQEESGHVINSVPSADRVWRQQTTQKDKALRASWWFQGAAFFAVVLVMSGAVSPISDFSYMPIAIVVPMILMAAPDWAGAAFHSITKFAQHKQSAKALKKLKTSPIKVLEPTELHHSLTLSAYTAKNRRLPLVSATFPATGIVCISGPSGCGKSSLLQSIAGVVPSTGFKEVDGMRIPDGLITNWRYVEQEPIVLSGSVSSNLDPAGMGIPLDDMTNLLAQLGLEALLPLSMWVGKAGRALSGGERKRLALARAILSHAKVLLVDEPFEGLDVTTQHKVCEVLNRYAANHLILVASHVIPSALNVSSTLPLEEARMDNLCAGQHAIRLP